MPARLETKRDATARPAATGATVVVEPGTVRSGIARRWARSSVARRATVVVARRATVVVARRPTVVVARPWSTIAVFAAALSFGGSAAATPDNLAPTPPNGNSLAAPPQAALPSPLAPPVVGTEPVTGTRPATSETPTEGTAIGLFGAQQAVWRPMQAGNTVGYDAVVRTLSVNRRGHFIGRQDFTGAIGGWDGGVEGHLHWLTSFGAGLFTIPSGLAYARLGLEFLTGGNSRARAGLLAPMLEVGHLWAASDYHVDLGLRFDTAALGGFSIEHSNSSYRHRLDLGAYASARVGPLYLGLEGQRRRLKADALDTLHLEGTLCGGGGFVVICTSASDYWLTESSQHLTQLTVAVGVGYFIRGK